MAPTIDFREEGNSVDPPSLQPPDRPSPPSLGDSSISEGPLSLFPGPTGITTSDLKNGTTFVFESSTTSSRARVETFSAVEGVQKMNTFVVDRDSHTTSISATGRISPLNESNSASASRGLAGVDGERIHVLTKDVFSDLQLAGRTGSGSFKESGDQSADLDTINKVTVDVSPNLQQKESIFSEPNESRGNCKQTDEQTPEQSCTEFNFEQSKLAYRLKPQLTSDFLTEELCSTTSTGTPPIDVDAILRKYGLETRKYNPPLARSNYAHGDTIETSTVSSHKSFSSCKFVSMPGASNAQNCNNLKGSYPPQMNLSQNNEALCKLIDLNSKPMNMETERFEESAVSVKPPEASAFDSKPLKNDPVKSTEIPDLYQMEKTQEPSKTSHSSSNADYSSRHDASTNNDIQEVEAFEEENSALTAAELSIAHGSSVDMTGNDRSEGFPGHEKAMPLSYGGSYSGLRGTSSVTSYASPYGGRGVTSGMRTGGFTMSSHASNMDVSPFEGSYLKHHLTMSGHPSTTGVGATTPGMATSSPSTTGSSRDNLSSAGSSLTVINSIGSPTDSLDYSLQKERYRLRGIDNLITSGPGRISRPFSTMPYMAIHTSTNFPITSSHRSTVNGLGNFMSSSVSYGNTKDIATIRRAGSNVDTGQFNNNRVVTDYPGYRANRYGSEIAQRLSLQEAWVKESPGRNQNQTAYKTQLLQKHQQMQNQNQVQKKQRVARTTKSSAGRNIIERNRLAVSQNALPGGKPAHSTGGKRNDQRPKSAQEVSTSVRGADSTYQRNNSYSAFPNSSGFVREFKRILRTSGVQDESKKAKLPMSNTNDLRKGKNNRTYCCSVSTKCKDSREDKAVKRGHMGKDLSTPMKRQQTACKYQPYLAKTNEKEERQQYTSQEQLVDINQTESASEGTLSISSSKASRSQNSCHVLETESNPDVSQLHSFPKYTNRCYKSSTNMSIARCHSSQEASQSSLVTATALASALIHKRKLQSERLQMFLPNSCPEETKKRSARAGKCSNTAAADNSALKMRTAVRKSTKKTTPSSVRPASARFCPFADPASKNKYYAAMGGLPKGTSSLRQ